MATTSRTRPQYDKWPREVAKVAELFLDPENIRLQIPVKSPQSIINDLFANEDAMQVLESIATNGFFPDELPVVVREKGKLVTIEGNRRVAALKAMARPELVPPKEQAIRDLVKGAGQFPRSLEVVVAPDRDSVRHFLASKHTQTTRRPWKPLRQAYFYKAELERGKTVEDLRREYPGVEIEKFLRMINVHRIAKGLSYDSDVVSKKVHNERAFPASTIERLYDDANVRKFLGFDFDSKGDVRIKIAKKEFEKGFKKIVQDVVTKYASGFGRVDSRTLNTEKERTQYLVSFPKSDQPKRSATGKVLTSKDFKTNPPVPAKRTKLAPRDIPFALQSAGVRRMLVELQEIDYRKFPNAAHDLLRSFLECSLKSYFEFCGKVITPNKGKYVFLDQVLQEFISEMTTGKKHKLLQIASRIRSNSTMTSYSTLFLNATNHNPDVFATSKEVEEAWDAMEPLLRYVLNPPKTNAAQAKP